MSARYLRFKQKFLHANLFKLSSTLTKFIKRGNLNLLNSNSLWRRFNDFNGQLNDLSREVGAYNRFWSKYLAIFFVCYIVYTVYMPFSFIFKTTEMNFFGKKFFLFFGCQTSSVLLWVSFECSKIVAKNIAIYREKRRFMYSFSKRYKMKLSDYFKVFKTSLILF